MPDRPGPRASIAARAIPGAFSPRPPTLFAPYASHIPQIINKGLVNEIFDRFVIRPDGPAYDEWSLYFNVASQLYPRHFATKPYGTLGWPMRPDKPGLYVIRFCAALDSGAQLEARGLLTVVAGEGGS